MKAAARMAVSTVCCMLASFAGCERPGVRSQEVAKGVERIPHAAGGVSSSADGSRSLGQRPTNDWEVPVGWIKDPQARQMRIATYFAPDPDGPVEVAVTRFAGRVGGEFANVNRWRGQMGLPAIGVDELDDAMTRYSEPGFEGYECRIESSAGVMLAAAVFDEAIRQTWFVRATVSNAEVADRLEADLFGMARSIATIDHEGDR